LRISDLHHVDRGTFKQISAAAASGIDPAQRRERQVAYCTEADTSYFGARNRADLIGQRDMRISFSPPRTE
jgi:hypothetical protein